MSGEKIFPDRRWNSQSIWRRSGSERRICEPSSRGTQSQTVRAEGRIISYSTEVFRRYQKHRYILGCIVDEKTSISIGTLMEIEKELSDTWTGFTRLTKLNEKPTDGYTWSG